MEHYVKIWDVVVKFVVRSYSFIGLVKKVEMSRALPNHVRFHVDQNMYKSAEANTRSPSYKYVQLNEVEEENKLLHSRSFAANYVDEVAIAVGDKSKILFYDRRMICYSKVNHSTKTVDTTSFNSDNFYIVQLKYNPSRNRFFITNSCSFRVTQYVVPARDTNVESMLEFVFRDQMVVGTVTKYSSFIRENNVLFDTYFRNYSAFLT